MTKDSNKPAEAPRGGAKGPGEQWAEEFLPESRTWPGQGTLPAPGMGSFRVFAQWDLRILTVW